MKNEKEIKVLREIEAEAQRFITRLHDSVLRMKEDDYYRHGCKQSGALKRAALDLKNELTRITQRRF